MPTQYLSDIPDSELGLTLDEGQPLMPRIAMQRDRQTWPGRVGPILAPYGTMDAMVRRFRWTGNVSTPATRSRVIEGLLDALTGSTELRDSETPGRVTRGVVRVFEPTIASPSFVNVEPTIVVEVECPNATWDTNAQSRVIGATPVQIPCGTLAHGGQFRLTGTAAGALSSEVRIRYRGISGTLLGELVLLPALASGEHVIIDSDSQEIVHVNTSNVLTSRESWITGGDFVKCYPRDGNRIADVWATLEVTAGVALYSFRRNWLG